jgi:hypothetical protein
MATARYRTKDGWSVEIVCLANTLDRHDGEWLRISYSVSSLEAWDLQQTTETAGNSRSSAPWVSLPVGQCAGMEQVA